MRYALKSFLYLKQKRNLKKYIKKNVKNNDYSEIMKFKNLLITSKHNETHTCSSPNCGCLICRDCWFKITHKGKDDMEATLDDMPSIYDYFRCPYCRNIDWKDYMKNVLNELQKKVLGEEEFNELLFKKCFPEYNK